MLWSFCCFRLVLSCGIFKDVLIILHVSYFVHSLERSHYGWDQGYYWVLIKSKVQVAFVSSSLCELFVHFGLSRLQLGLKVQFSGDVSSILGAFEPKTILLNCCVF